jgi:hypothetical protein
MLESSGSSLAQRAHATARVRFQVPQSGQNTRLAPEIHLHEIVGRQRPDEIDTQVRLGSR